MVDRRAQRRIALVTGVSRQAGIGFAVAQRLLSDGYTLVIHSWPDHDARQPWGADPGGMAGIVSALGAADDRLAHIEADFAQADGPRRVIDFATARFGALDVLVVNHAHSSDLGLLDVTATELDLAWAVNARATVLLVQAFAQVHDDGRRDGRIVLFTSGQYLSPMASELPYAISKGAVHQMTLSLADALADRAITVNAIHPGPVDTGWPSPATREHLRKLFPAGRLGTPGDIAPIVSFLASPESAWITGQVISAEGGFRR